MPVPRASVRPEPRKEPPQSVLTPRPRCPRPRTAAPVAAVVFVVPHPCACLHVYRAQSILWKIGLRHPGERKAAHVDMRSQAIVLFAGVICWFFTKIACDGAGLVTQGGARVSLPARPYAPSPPHQEVGLAGMTLPSAARLVGCGVRHSLLGRPMVGPSPQDLPCSPRARPDDPTQPTGGCA